MQDKNKVIEMQEIKNGNGVSFVPEEDYAKEPVTRFCRKGNLKWWIFAFILAILAMVVILTVTKPNVVDDATSVSTQVVTTEDQIYEATYVERNLVYRDCGHTETQLLHGEAEFVGKTFKQLEEAGWEVSKIGSNKVRLAMELTGICAEDSEKRTLKLTDNGIGVFEGPKNISGKMLSEMEIDINNLPQELQDSLNSGGIEFQSEDELLETLESLDEYVSSEYEEYYSGII